MLDEPCAAEPGDLSTENVDALKQHVLSKLEDSPDFDAAFLVLDPFNHSYNPAKSIKDLSSQNENYHKAWNKVLRGCLLNGLKSTSDTLGQSGMEMV